MQEYTRKELMELFGCSISSFSMYMQRPEFANIKRYRKKGHRTTIYYSNVTEENIKLFKELMKRKKGYYYV